MAASLAIAAAVALAWLADPQSEPQAIEGRVSRVVDGDSLHLATHEPQIRLWGVDAPERGERGYQEAKDELRRLTAGASLSCQPIYRDRYGRTVARCFRADGQEVNRMMIDGGTAAEFMRYSRGFYSKP